MVKYGIRNLLHAVMVVDNLQHAIIVLLLEKLDNIAVHDPVEGTCVADEVLGNDYSDVVGQTVLRTVSACVDAVAHLRCFLLDSLAQLRTYAVAVAKRLGYGYGADIHSLCDVAHGNGFFRHLNILSCHLPAITY